MICCNAAVKQLLFNYSHNVYKVYDYLFNIYLCTVLEKYLIFSSTSTLILEISSTSTENVVLKYLYLDPSLACIQYRGEIAVMKM